MPMPILRPGLLAVACALVSLGHAQDPCSTFYRSAPRSSDPRFSLNGQSKGASVQVGVPTELNIIVYKGQDYRISFVYDEKVIGDHVVARLIERIREPKEVEDDGKEGGGRKRVFAEARKVLWDNQEHGMADAVEFTATATKRIAVEITAPGVPDGAKQKRGDRDHDIGCVGILIEHMPTPNVGF